MFVRLDLTNNDKGNEWNESATRDINSAWEVKRDVRGNSVQGRVSGPTSTSLTQDRGQGVLDGLVG